MLLHYVSCFFINIFHLSCVLVIHKYTMLSKNVKNVFSILYVFVFQSIFVFVHVLYNLHF